MKFSYLKSYLLLFSTLLLASCNTIKANPCATDSIAETPTVPVNTTSSTVVSTESSVFTITLNFMGDCTLGTQLGADTLGRFNATAMTVNPKYFFDGVRDVLNEGTFNITNCEGVLTDNPLPEAYKDYSPAFWFKSSASNARIFSENNINLVGIANNHINDYSDQGRLDTIKAIENNGILWSDNDKSVIIENHDIKIAVFCVTLWNSHSQQKICDEIINAKLSTDLQIVFFHGGTENIHKPDDYKIESAHAFVDAGADLVVGSHPHVLQPIENYNGVNIVYSLGNFVYGGHLTPENRTIVYQHTFTFDDKFLRGSSETVYPCYIYTGDVNEYQPTLITDEHDKQTVLDFMYGKVDSPL